MSKYSRRSTVCKYIPKTLKLNPLPGRAFFLIGCCNVALSFVIGIINRPFSLFNLYLLFLFFKNDFLIDCLHLNFGSCSDCRQQIFYHFLFYSHVDLINLYIFFCEHCRAVKNTRLNRFNVHVVVSVFHTDIVFIFCFFDCRP